MSVRFHVDSLRMTIWRSFRNIHTETSNVIACNFTRLVCSDVNRAERTKKASPRFAGNPCWKAFFLRSFVPSKTGTKKSTKQIIHVCSQSSVIWNVTWTHVSISLIMMPIQNVSLFPSTDKETLRNVLLGKERGCDSERLYFVTDQRCSASSVISIFCGQNCNIHLCKLKLHANALF